MSPPSWPACMLIRGRAESPRGTPCPASPHLLPPRYCLPRVFSPLYCHLPPMPAGTTSPPLSCLACVRLVHLVSLCTANLFLLISSILGSRTAGPHTQFVHWFMEECVGCLEQDSRGSILQFMPFTTVSTQGAAGVTHRERRGHPQRKEGSSSSGVTPRSSVRVRLSVAGIGTGKGVCYVQPQGCSGHHRPQPAPGTAGGCQSHCCTLRSSEPAVASSPSIQAGSRERDLPHPALTYHGPTSPSCCCQFCSFNQHPKTLSSPCGHPNSSRSRTSRRDFTGPQCVYKFIFIIHEWGVSWFLCK